MEFDEYRVVDCNGISEYRFKTVYAAEDHIARKAKEQVLESWMNEIDEGRNDEWVETHTIIAVIKRVKPVPIVKKKVKIELDEVK